MEITYIFLQKKFISTYDVIYIFVQANDPLNTSADV